jgi:hypothetical protein
MKKPGYLKNPENGRVLPWTQILENRGNMIPCDADGNPQRVDDITTPAVAKTVDPGNPEYRKQQEKRYRDEFDGANAYRKTLREAEYDGVAGVLPDWVPARDRNQFEDEKERLLTSYTYEQLLEFLELWPKYIEEGLKHRRLRIVDYDSRKIPLTFKNALSDDSPFARMEHPQLRIIDHLVLIKKAVDAGQQEGLRILADDYASTGYAAREARKRGAEESNKERTTSRNLCVQWAAGWWDQEAARNEEITRIGVVSYALWNRLKNEGHWHPTSHDQVREWLKDAGRKGELTIPKHAQKSGRMSM